VTRCRHHAISIIVDGLLIIPARGRTACRPLSKLSTAVIDTFDLTGSISPSLIGVLRLLWHIWQAISRREEPLSE
jgi:hypothetical protein